ncbi:MAG: proprotein convertase P-domain-containing protein [Candidatus Kaiserbacteria bacterium]|nr:proprotein convertase P-domain-containing protein [Candidatus Kaiserbacteria bacterium]
MILLLRCPILIVAFCASVLIPFGAAAQDIIAPVPDASEYGDEPDFLSRIKPDVGEARTLVWDVLTENYSQHAVPDSYTAALNQPLIRQLDRIPVVLSGILDIHDRETLYIGIDPEYYEEHGAKELRRDLEQRFPSVPIHIEPTEGVSRMQGVAGVLPESQSASSATRAETADDLTFVENKQVVIPDNTKQMQEVGAITVPGAETVESVSVAVDIMHTYVSDLRVELVSPTGVSVVLFDGPAGPDNDSDDLIASWDFSNTFRGLPASGTWRLLAGDYVVNDSGLLRSWRLTITPTGQRIQAPNLPDEETVAEHFFFEDFENGMDSWEVRKDRGDIGWRATTLDEQRGSENDSIVAQSEECDEICILTLRQPLDLRGHSAMTLSFDRWVDDALDEGEHLTVGVLIDGRYREVARWSQENGGNDGRWHREEYNLTADDLAASSFNIQFISKNSTRFEEVAIDNVALTPSVPPITIDTPETPDDSTPPVTVDVPDGPPYAGCFGSPERDDPMGGDIIFSRPIDRGIGGVSCGTLTLTGVRTIDGKEGAVISAHVVDLDFQHIDTFIGHVYDVDAAYRIRRPVGRVERMPFILRGGVLGSIIPDSIVLADAAFVEYPQGSGCLLSWLSDGISHCFQHEYHRPTSAMRIRGKDGAVYTVVGSQKPYPGMSVMISGAISGTSEPKEVVHQLLSVQKNDKYEYVYTASRETILRQGDSGAPVYTIPDRYGEVSMVGIFIGYAIYAGERYHMFSSWDTVRESLRLRSL